MVLFLVSGERDLCLVQIFIFLKPWATQENKEEVVRELLKNGADPIVQDCEGFSPCIYSSQ